MTTSALDDLLPVLRASHDRLTAAIGGLDERATARPSYDAEWSVADVASHIGSSAEIFSGVVTAGLSGSAPPDFQAIWDRWNAKAPLDQVIDAVPADAALLDRIDALSPTERQRWRLDLFGAEQDLESLARMRLSEHAVHTWDIVVAFDPEATIAVDPVARLVDMLPAFAQRAGRPSTTPATVAVTAVEPGRRFRLELDGDGARLTPTETAEPAPASLRLSSEALVRLVYGRLDADHTPTGTEATGVELDVLRAAFPGF